MNLFVYLLVENHIINIHIISGVKISKFSITRIVDSKCENQFIDTSQND